MDRPRLIRWLRIFILMNLGVNLGAVAGISLGRLSPSNPIPFWLFGVGLGMIGASLCEWYRRSHPLGMVKACGPTASIRFQQPSSLPCILISNGLLPSCGGLIPRNYRQFRRILKRSRARCPETERQPPCARYDMKPRYGMMLR